MAEAGSSSQEPYRFRIGSYGIIHPLGSGGMSSVFRAAHLETGHEVALKVLPSYMARNSTILKRFVAEVRSAESLEHPNIVSIYDRGSDEGRYYLVLEYVQGGDLHDYVQNRGPLDPDEAIGLIAQAARGLEYAMSRGVIHRDVKPSNLLRTPLGELKITDLGLAVRPESEDERVTREGTTVGTVDYMAPEQARDSRATSFQSDVYSLGCTLYYLLAAQPPFPGGDITEKLTNHARTPPPDVRDLRPDLPPALADLIRRMLAKRPEDRFASYRDLLAALGALGGDESSVALVPIDDEPTPLRLVRDRPAARVAAAPDRVPEPRPTSSLPEISLSALGPELLADAAPPRPALAGPGPALLSLPVSTPPGAVAPGPRQSAPVSEDAWIIRCVVLGAIVIVAVIGLDLILRPFPDPASLRFPESPDSGLHRVREIQPDQPEVVAAAVPPPAVEAEPVETAPAEPEWVEPTDVPEADRPPKVYPPAVLSAYLPSWALTPVRAEADGPTTVVRRAADGRDSGEVASLRQALDVPRGTVELADVGPFVIDDLRVAGESRVIRSRPGYRATVLVEGPKIEAVRALPGVFTLDGRELTLDSLDLVVNVRALAINQRALFHGSGFRLTLKNCTVTIYNPNRAPFAFLRTEEGARASTVRIEDSLIRGDVATLFELNRGEPAEIVAARSILASEGPLLRTPDVSPKGENQLYLLGCAVGSRGPMIDLGGGKADAPGRRLRVRAFDSVFGRFAGAGVASLTSSDRPDAVVGRQLDWMGANNQFAGWVGYHSAGPDHAITKRTLAAFSSTWNAAGVASREIVNEWPETRWVADLTPGALTPFLPGWEPLVEDVAQPRPFLKYRTVLNFPAPETPRIVPATGPAPPGAVELTFDADAPQPWNGDLGAFLRDRGGEPRGRLRVRVVGSGAKRMSPVRLPEGSTVEIRVEHPADPEALPLVFSPASDAEGEPLIAATGGVLSLSGLRLLVEQDCRLPTLIRVDDGSLALDRCELSIPVALEHPPALVSFRAPTTRPRLVSDPPSPIAEASDRPVCVVADSVLITTGDALRAEVGRGLVAVSRCIVAAKGDAFTLTPARVARSRFLADLRLDRCTVAVGGAAVRMSAWSGEAPGPDRPWLVTSGNTAYLDFSDRPPRKSVLCRADADCFAQGQIFWSQGNDAIEVYGFAAAGDAPPPNRTRDVVAQWVDLWGPGHVKDVTGPRAGVASPSVRLQARPRNGRITPDELLLDPNHHVGRSRLDVGASPEVLLLGRAPPLGRKR
ncbi:serine/threonine-protein kinase [Paludisphaera soli]|uniref:serine/threonine-protein kinase n=1 Tax=Paludisphaera soli TaxID=2712865 RepID=UPI0013EB391D|nr:serine/threonine-protein kinase [Paludisphaera soli]